MNTYRDWSPSIPQSCRFLGTLLLASGVFCSLLAQEGIDLSVESLSHPSRESLFGLSFGLPEINERTGDVALKLETSRDLEHWDWMGTILTHPRFHTPGREGLFLPIAYSRTLPQVSFRMSFVDTQSVTEAYGEELPSYLRFVLRQSDALPTAVVGPDEFRMQRSRPPRDQFVHAVELSSSRSAYLQRHYAPARPSGVGRGPIDLEYGLTVDWDHVWKDWKTEYWLLTLIRISNPENQDAFVSRKPSFDRENNITHMRYQFTHFDSLEFDLIAPDSDQAEIVLDSTAHPFDGGGILILEVALSAERERNTISTTYIRAPRTADIWALSAEGSSNSRGFYPYGDLEEAYLSNAFSEWSRSARLEYPEFDAFLRRIEAGDSH